MHEPLARKTEAEKGAPILIFFHGGAYVGGERNVNADVYGNIATYFARQGLVGINGTYRLTRGATWPAAARGFAQPFQNIGNQNELGIYENKK